MCELGCVDVSLWRFAIFYVSSSFYAAEAEERNSQNVYSPFDLMHVAEMNDFRAEFMAVMWLIVI